MQISGALQIWIAIFFIVLSLATIAIVIFIGIVLIQFKKNLKSFELLITEEISPTISEVKLTLSKLNNIVSNIDGSVGKVKDSISEIRNTVGKIINGARNVVGVFDKPWIKIIASGIIKGWGFIRKKNRSPEGSKSDQDGEILREEEVK